MKIFEKISQFIVWIVGIILVLCILFSGCDRIKCYPQYDINDNYIGIKCGGQF